MKKNIFIVIGVVIFVLLITGFVKKQSQVIVIAKQEITTEIVSNEVFFENNTFGSFIKNSNEAIISTQLRGNVKKIYVKEGDIVKKGQILVWISAPEIVAQYAGVDAQVKIAKEQEKNARRHWDDYKPEVREQFKLQTQQVDAARAEVSAMLSKTKIVAPFAGVVSKKYVTEGETVTTGQQIMYLTGNLSRQEVVINVPTTVGASVSVDDVVNISDGINNVEAYISAVSPVSDKFSRKITLRVVLDEQSPFALGSFVDVVVSSNESINGVRVSKKSVVKQYNDTFVFVVEGGIAQMRKISILAELGEFVIVNGIDSGSEVVSSGAHNIQDGEEIITTN